jgi:hypothetical protein
LGEFKWTWYVAIANIKPAQETRQFGMILLLLVAVDAIGIDTKGTISAF